VQKIKNNFFSKKSFKEKKKTKKILQKKDDK
jgi:hypothetical protein